MIELPATKRGVYHNLKESKYTVSNSEIVFFFSSKFLLTKFMDGYKENRSIFLNKIAKIVVENPLNMTVLADIDFYMSTEKRGFHAMLKGVTIDCEELHRYALRKMTEKNTLDWYVIQKPKLEERLRIME